MEALQTISVTQAGDLPAWDGDFVRSLRAAVMEGDEAAITRLISDLLRVKGLTRGHRIALQLRTLMYLVTSLRSAAVTDELTGLYNRRGFLQAGRRFLQVAKRELQPAYLLYCDLDGLKQVNDTYGHTAGDALLKQTGNLLRDLFPEYGVFSVLGRLGGDEFAVLTMRGPGGGDLLLRARRPQAGSWDVRPLSLSVGTAYFDPRSAWDICDLLKSAEQGMYEQRRQHRRLDRSASSGPPPDRRLMRN